MTDEPKIYADDDAAADLPTEHTLNTAVEIERLQAELAEARDRALRTQAETENARKRMRREQEEDRKYASLPMLMDLLPVVDNVARAIEAAEKAAGAEPVVAGFKMVAQQLDTALAKHQCTRIPALHQPFDPHLHAAILQQPSADFPPNTVLVVAQEGFQLHDRVLRPAQVIVSKSDA